MVDREVEKTLTQQQVANAAENLGVVALAQLWQQHADRLHALSLKRARDHARLIVELGRCRFDALPGGLRDRSARRIVKDERYRRWTKAEMFSQHFEAGRTCHTWRRRGLFCHKRWPEGCLAQRSCRD